MKAKLNLAIVGVTGAVGQQILKILAERNLAIGNLYLLASHRSVGQSIVFADQTYWIEDLADFDFSQADIAIFSVAANIAAEFIPKATTAGCIVIDKSSQFRYEPDIPLVIPEINPDDIALYQKRYIIASPNCSTIQMLVALMPIYDAVGIERINICTYQSVSGSGLEAIEELCQQTQAILNDATPSPSKTHSQILAFNCLPVIDRYMENDYTQEEMKIVWETRKILHDDHIQINPTAVRVPVINGHAEAIHIETRDKITKQQALALLKQAPGVQVMEDDFPSQRVHADGHDAVYVGRVREDISHPRGLNLWVAADNLRKGAALNAIQIVELLLRDYL